MIVNWLNNIEFLYAVNPIIFGVLYFGTFVPCWYFIYKIISSIRKKNIDKIFLFFILELFFLALPYFYVLIWGRNFPFWIYIILILLAIASVFSGCRAIFKQVSKENKSELLWDLCSWAYKNAVGHSISHKKMFKDVIKSLNLKNSEKCLDAGCGAGDLEKYICSQKSNIDIEAIDFSLQMIKGAKRKCIKRGIKFRQADLNQPLPYHDNHFDSVVCTQVLFALPRIKFTLKEFSRVLKKNGKLIIVEPKPDANMGKTIIANFKELADIKGYHKVLALLDLVIRFPLGIIVLLFNLIMSYWQKQNFYHFYSVEELKKYLNGANFKIVKIGSTLAEQDNLLISYKSF